MSAYRPAKYDNPIIVNGCSFHNIEAAEDYARIENETGKPWDFHFFDGSVEARY